MTRPRCTIVTSPTHMLSRRYGARTFDQLHVPAKPKINLKSTLKEIYDIIGESSAQSAECVSPVSNFGLTPITEKRLLADLADEVASNPPDTLPEFIEDYFIQK